MTQLRSMTPSVRMGWAAMALVSLALFGNFYVYDSIGPVADLLEQQLGFTDTQIGTLNAVYSLPNVVLILFGGMLVDRYGAGRMATITAALCFAGAVLTAASSSFPIMTTGRLFYGIGSETFNIATLAAVTLWFPLRHTALAMGLTLSIGRAGSFAADISPSALPGVYAQGWQAPLVLAAGLAATSLAGAALYWWFERRAGLSGKAHETSASSPFVLRDLLRFPRTYWYLLVLCVLWYAAILAFRSTFAIKYFQHAHGLTLAAAGALNSYVYLSAMFATPFFGWLCDRLNRYSGMLAFGAFLLPTSLLVMSSTELGLGIATALIGVSYSLVPAAMWPLVSRLVDSKRFGTAIGLMWVVQNAGIGSANLIAGHLNDANGAGADNPAGYDAMMNFFTVSSLLGFAFALLLWRSTRKANG